MSSGRVAIGESAFGRGLYAAQTIFTGQPILTFEGPVLSHAEVLVLGDAQAYALQIGPDEYLDTQAPGRFTNHSCEPNAGLMYDRLLVALRPIAVNEEVQFDYSTTMSENHWTMDCRCGHPSCRRVIRDFHHLPPDIQTRYLRRGVVQRFIVKEIEARRSTRAPRRWTRQLPGVSP